MLYIAKLAFHLFVKFTDSYIRNNIMCIRMTTKSCITFF